MNKIPKYLDTNLIKFFEKSKYREKKMLVKKLAELLVGTELGIKLESCATYLILAECQTPEEVKHRLHFANFCKNRICPFCTFLKSRKRLRSLLLNQERINGKYLLLTLTVPETRVDVQKKTVQQMATAFHRLKQYPCWKPVVGYFRGLETTRGSSNDSRQSHPHFHCLLEVKPTYFGKHYIRHEEWLRSWRDAYRDQRIMQVNVQRLKPKKGSSEIFTGFFEALKYELKPDSWEKLKPNETTADLRDWILTYASQMKDIRSISTGGTLKGITTEPKDLEDEDFEDEVILRFLAFQWLNFEAYYGLSQELDEEQVKALIKAWTKRKKN